MSSPRTAERLSRLLAMVPWVVAHPGAGVAGLQERFGYERRADLIRDLHLVFVCGLPGYGPGDLIDMTIDDDEVYIDLADYFNRPMRLTAPEALMLLATGSAVISSGTAPPALESAVAKLRRAMAVDDGILDIDIEPESAPTTVLREAAADHRAVRITHTSVASGQTAERVIEPWAVFTTLGRWYVTGHCRMAGSERVFRIDRIREVALLDEHFDPPGSSPEPVVEYTPGPDDVTARIRLAPSATWVAEYYPVSIVETGDDGSLVVDFNASDPAVAARVLLKLGDSADLLDGDKVADAARDLRQRILQRYA